MELVIAANGETRLIYQDEVDLSTLGAFSIRRASHVESNSQGGWWADLGPVGGPVLGPYLKRKEALESEVIWIQRHVLTQQ